MFRHTLRRLQGLRSAARPPARSNTSREPRSPRQPGIPGPTGPDLITPELRREYTPSQRVVEFANELRITFPSAMRLGPGQKTKDFPIRFYTCKHHVFSFYHVKFLQAYEHPLIDKILHFYTQEKLSRPLWCYVQSTATDGSNAVVRQTSERAVRAALFKALNAAGYDSYGKSLDGSRGKIQGTLRIHIMEPKAILKVDFQQLVNYLTNLVSLGLPRLSNSRSDNDERRQHRVTSTSRPPRSEVSLDREPWIGDGKIPSIGAATGLRGPSSSARRPDRYEHRGHSAQLQQRPARSPKSTPGSASVSNPH